MHWKSTIHQEKEKTGYVSRVLPPTNMDKHPRNLSCWRENSWVAWGKSALSKKFARAEAQKSKINFAACCFCTAPVEITLRLQILPHGSRRVPVVCRGSRLLVPWLGDLRCLSTRWPQGPPHGLQPATRQCCLAPTDPSSKLGVMPQLCPQQGVNVDRTLQTTHDVDIFQESHEVCWKEQSISDGDQSSVLATAKRPGIRRSPSSPASPWIFSWDTPDSSSHKNVEAEL